MLIFRMLEQYGVRELRAPDNGDGGGGGAGGSGDGAGGAGDGQGGGDGAGGGAKKDPPQGGGDGAGGAGDGQGGGDGKDKGTWGADWREAYAAEDASKLGVLKRYSSPKDALDAMFAMRQKVHSGELKAPLAKDATPEQVAEYRKSNGIPDKPEAYLEGLPKELVFGDEEKEGLTLFAKAMHDENASPAMVHKALSAYQEIRDEEVLKKHEANEAANQKTEDELRLEWGNDYRGNVNLANAMLATAMPAEDLEKFGQYQDANGVSIMNNPHFVRFLANTARELNPSGTVVHGKGMDSVDAIDDAIAGYEKRMREDRAAWFKDEKAQTHLRQLYAAKERIGGAKA